MAGIKRTDSGRLNHVADGESLDCLILGGAARAVAASDGLDVAAALLVAAAGMPLVNRLERIAPSRVCCYFARKSNILSYRELVSIGSEVVTQVEVGRMRENSYLFFLFLTILTVSVASLSIPSNELSREVRVGRTGIG